MTVEPGASGRGPAGAFEQLRDTVKWLMTAGAALTTVLVAGLQLRDITDVLGSASTERRALALTSVGVALVLVLSVVAACARILSTPRRSIRDLADRELKAGGSPLIVRLSPLSDRLVQSILERRTYLLVGFNTIGDFYSSYQVHLQSPNVDPANRTAAVNMERAVERVEDWAQFLDAHLRFRRLTRWFWPGGLLLATALVTLTATTAVQSDSSVVVDDAVAVTVYLRSTPSELGFPATCRETQLEGFAIGGTFENPTLSIPGPPSCGPLTLSLTSGQVVVVPLP